MKIVNCETGEPVDVGYVDGYIFADTMLEGLMFAITIEDGKPVCNGWHPRFDEYMKRFVKAQTDEWCATALDCADDAMTTLDGQIDLMFDAQPA